MGLFDFARKLGKKLFSSGDERAAEKIREHIEEDNPGIKDLEVDYDDGKVSISGDAKDAEAVEKAVLMAGNVEGVEEVDISDVEAPEIDDRVHYYVIEKGDTLWKISERFLGKGDRYPEIFEANREVIKDPDLIYPGQKIRIPPD